MTSTGTTAVKERCSAEEWQMRVDLAAAYRLVHHFGWDDLVFTHISARVPGAEHQFLVNPFGLMFDEITASNLVKVDLDGTIIDPTPYRINPAGFTIHSAIHAASEDTICVLHLHTVAGVAVSSQKGGLLPISQFAMVLNDDIAYHQYEGIALNLDERPRLVADLGSKKAMILHNHGTLTVGTSVAGAFLSMYFLERACATQVAALAGDREVIVPSDSIQAVVRQQAAQEMAMAQRLVWPTLIRLIDRKDPGYRN